MRATVVFATSGGVGEVLGEEINAGLGRTGGDDIVLKKVAEDFGEVGFAGTEKAGQPNSADIARMTAATDRIADGGVGIEDAFQLLLDFIRENVFAKFRSECRTVEDFDDTLDLYGDVAADEIADGVGHSDCHSLKVILTAR